MQLANKNWCCGGNLRLKCFIIGYMNLVASIVGISLHLLIVSIVTNGFQCDVDKDRFDGNNWTWFEPFLLIIDMGSHGFYPFPQILSNNALIDYMPDPIISKCYPGMMHIQLIEVLNFFINAIWLKFVVSYVAAVHKKDPESMRMFLGMSTVKLILQVLYIDYEPALHHVLATEAYWFYKAVDIFIAAIFLFVIHKYIRQLRAEKLRAEQPPSYIECLINGTSLRPCEKKSPVEESKVDVPAPISDIK